MGEENADADNAPPSNPLFDPTQDNVVSDTAVLQGISHPLRLRLLGLLRTHGPSTATRLAEQCDVSSGLTSYHLRQLAATGLVTDAEAADVPGAHTTGGRQRWWKAVGRSMFTSTPAADDEEALAITDEFTHAALAATNANARRWLSVAHSWPDQWRETVDFSDVALRLTHEEAAQLGTDIASVLARYRRLESPGQPTSDADTDDNDADTVIVWAQYQIFPLADQDPPDAAE